MTASTDPTTTTAGIRRAVRPARKSLVPQTADDNSASTADTRSRYRPARAGPGHRRVTLGKRRSAAYSRRRARTIPPR